MLEIKNMETKLGFEIDGAILDKDISRLTNQIWKLIPMKENEENWQVQLSSVIIELVGLNEIFNFSAKYLILLSKLLGLQKEEVEFVIFRKAVFESISLLREVANERKK